MQAGFTHSRGCANKYRLRVVAGDSLINGDVRGSEKGFPESGGFPRLPEQSTERKQLVSVMKVVILIFAVTDYRIPLSCGRAQRPAPTG